MAELYVSTPTYYISKRGALDDLSKTLNEITEKGQRKLLLVWSVTAKEKIGNTVHDQLDAAGYQYIEEDFRGYPSERQARKYADLATQNQVDVLLAFGGGRVIDVTKAAGTFSGKKVITVPTIAATCAAWAAVSILYHEDGSFDKGFRNPKSPVAIIADTDIIASAPSRFLKAGAADTLAKWYEPHYTESFVNKIASHAAEIAKDFITSEGPSVIADTEKGKIDDKTVKLVDSIIYLAGFVGSFVGDLAYSGLAHPFYFSARDFEPVRQKLHGEVVAYGLIVQAVLEEKDAKEIKERLNVLKSLDNLFTSDEIGLSTQETQKKLAQKLNETFPYTEKYGATPNHIFDAIQQADNLVLQYRKDRK